ELGFCSRAFGVDRSEHLPSCEFEQIAVPVTRLASGRLRREAIQTTGRNVLLQDFDQFTLREFERAGEAFAEFTCGEWTGGGFDGVERGGAADGPRVPIPVAGLAFRGSRWNDVEFSVRHVFLEEGRKLPGTNLKRRYEQSGQRTGWQWLAG